MRPTFQTSVLALSLGLSALPAWSYGQIDSFEASATQVVAGSTVSFTVSWRVQGSFQSGGSSNLVEPAPAEGYQEWVQNWHWTDSITARGIDLQVGNQVHSELISVDEGAGASGTWGFSMVLDTPGLVELSVSGGFSVRQTTTSESQLATRTCYNTGSPDGGVELACDSSWSLSYPQTRNESDFGGSLNTPSLQIEVLAVPEPATTALWLVGLAAVGTVARRQALRRRTPLE